MLIGLPFAMPEAPSESRAKIVWVISAQSPSPAVFVPAGRRTGVDSASRRIDTETGVYGTFPGDCGGSQHRATDESDHCESESERSRRQGEQPAESRDTDEDEEWANDDPDAAVKSADVFLHGSVHQL